MLVEVNVWLNLIVDVGPMRESNTLEPIMQEHDNLWDAWFSIIEAGS